jgi:hypothetical protein
VARLNRPWVAPVLLGLLTLAITLWLWRWASAYHTWQNDEELYRHFARGVSRDWGLLFHMDPSYGRGVQRLHLLVMAIPMALFKAPLAFVIAHLLFVAIYTSATIPTWLIARGCGLTPLAALVPAVLVVLTPWAVVSTSFLAEPVGYGVFAWALWATWRAAVRPSIGADVLAVVLMGVALVARTGFLLLVPVLPAVAVLQSWRYGTGDGAIGARLRRLPGAALRRQPLSVGIGLLGALIFLLAWTRILPGGPNRFTGTYSTHLPPLWLIGSKWRSFLSRIDAGTGFLLFAAALPWLFARIARPREPAFHAIAWTLLLASLSVLLALVGGPADERYVMFLGLTIPLAASIALLRRDVGPVMLALGGAAAFVLFFTPGWKLVDPSDFGYFGYPTESFVGRVVLVKLKLALSSVDPKLTGGILLAGALIALVAVSARWRRWLPLAIVPAAMFQLAASGYAINKHINTVGTHHGPGLKSRSFADVHVPRDADVGILATSRGGTPDYALVWREVQFWNLTTHSVVKIISPVTYNQLTVAPYPFGTHDVQAPLDLKTGKVTWKGPWPFPDYLVIPQPPLSVILQWTPVAQATYIPASLVKVKQPLQARATLAGVTFDGFTDPATPATITVYSAGQPRTRCVFADLLTPELNTPGKDVSLRFVVTHDGKTIARGAVPHGKLQRVYMPVDGFDGPATSFEIKTFKKIDATGGKLGLQVGNYELLTTACPS